MPPKRQTEILPVGTKITRSQVDYDYDPRQYLMVKKVVVTGEWNMDVHLTVTPTIKDQLRELYSGSTHVIAGVEVEHKLITNQAFVISFFLDEINIDEQTTIIHEDNKFGGVTRYYLVPSVEFRKFARHKHAQTNKYEDIVSVRRLEHVFQGGLQWQVFLVDNELITNDHYQYLQYTLGQIDEINQRARDEIEHELQNQQNDLFNSVVNIVNTLTQTKTQMKIYKDLFEKCLREIFLSKVDENEAKIYFKNKFIQDEFDVEEYDEMQKKWRKILANNMSTVKDVVNVLLIGQEGAGKSTFINSICNYLKHASLEDAKINVQNIIPTVFTMVNSNKTISFRTGGLNNNEDTKTKMCKTYEIHIGNFIYKFIDTPGFNTDKRKVGEKSTKQQILKYIEKTPIDAILVLIKSYESSSNEFLQFIRKIQDFYNKINKNMFICFTYSKYNSFRGGETLSILLDNLKDVETNFLKTSSFYFFDNEPYRYLNSYNDIEYTLEEFENVLFSWQRSKDETKRLFDVLSGFGINRSSK